MDLIEAYSKKIVVEKRTTVWINPAHIIRYVDIGGVTRLDLINGDEAWIDAKAPAYIDALKKREADRAADMRRLIDASKGE